MVLETREIKATLFELVDGDFSFALRFDIPVKVELPRGDWLGQVTLIVAERDAQLDDL